MITDKKINFDFDCDIDIPNGRLAGSELSPSPDDVKGRIRQTVDDFIPVI